MADVQGQLISNEGVADWDENGQLLAPPTMTEANALDSTDTTKPEEEEEEAPSEEPNDPEEETEVEYVADPGEYMPADYSFKVTTFDEEGNKPKVHKITNSEEWNKLLELEPNFGSYAALSKAEKLVNKMENNLASDYKEWEKKKQDYEAVSTEETNRLEQITSWQNEMNYLVERGDLPKIAKKYQDADWNDPEVAKQEGIKEQIELLKFTEKENKLRKKAGLKPMSSLIDSFNAFSRKNPRTPTAEDKKAAGQARKVAGARVSSGAALPVSTAPKGIMVGRGGSLNDLGNDWL